MRFDTVGVERLWRREDNKATASLKFRPLTCMTRSMLLKFLLQRKQRARLVFGFVAVLNSEHIGQRKRKVPSISLADRDGITLMSRSMGIEFLRM